mmetsp:Transcript_5676/g.8617  ORF Transcript_5676/g.8617 Transcript_5676/m.8617 type:complete len:189 (+) Transcript_5676:126-692(+)
MPPKKKRKLADTLMTPQVFEASVAQLNIHLVSSVAGESSNDSGSVSATDRRKSNADTITKKHIFCSKEAMEILRQAHGQFVALLSSEIASGEDASKKSHSDSDSIRTIMPKHVKVALERLEFVDIASSPHINFDDSAGASGGSEKGAKTARVKKNVKNRAMTEELLKEQERLFAMSAAKMKDSSGGTK